MKDWINLHYAGKKGEIYTEFKEIGEFLEDEIGAKFLEERKTKIGTFYKYYVSDLESAYRHIFMAFRFLPWS